MFLWLMSKLNLCTNTQLSSSNEALDWSHNLTLTLQVEVAESGYIHRLFQCDIGILKSDNQEIEMSECVLELVL